MLPPVPGPWPPPCHPPLVPVAPTSTGVGRHPRPLGVGAGSRRRILGSPLALPAAARSGVLSERRGGKQ